MKIGQIEIDGNSHKFGYERDETFEGLKYKISDLTTRVIVWRDEKGKWHQEAKGSAPLSQDTLEKVIEEILANP